MQSSKKRPITRRSFAVGAAMAATATLLPEKLAGQSTATPTPQPDSTTKLSPGAKAEVEMKVKEIFRKYGDRLSDAQKADIRKVMAETQDGLEKMRSFALDNGDQPAMVLKLYSEGRHKTHAE